MKYICLLSLVLCLLYICGCPADEIPTRTAAALRNNDNSRSEQYRANSAFFERAALFKPLEGSASGRTFSLAPLIVQECDAIALPEGLRFTAPEELSRDRPQRNITPIVYYAENTISIAGQDRDQLTYLWFYSHWGFAQGQACFRGIRMTLDRQGFPMIYEVLESPEKLAIVFVSKSLEESAHKQYGTPLPQRRHSSESSVAGHPLFVVARVVEDGPQPMGPYVYLNRELDVTTLHCRCSPSQVKDFTENNYYELRPLASLKSEQEKKGVPTTNADIHLPRQEMSDPMWLTRVLRLPDGLP
jgi:hypothetical protein